MKIEVLQKVHSQQAVHTGVALQGQHADFKLIDLPVPHRKGIEFIHRRAHPAVCRGKHRDAAGIPMADAALLQCGGCEYRQGGTGIDEQLHARPTPRTRLDNEMIAAAL